jgi:arsenate reductase
LNSPSETPRPALKRVLFVCIGNACRSQMAEAIAKKLAADVIEPASAGISPLGYIAPPTRIVLSEKEMSCEHQTSKPLRHFDLRTADLIINMTGYPGDTLFENEHLPLEDWVVGDPFGSDLEVYRRIRDDIEHRVLELAGRLRQAAD